MAIMRRMQIQLPDPLYRRVKSIAASLDVSVAELMRRGAEYIAACYPEEKLASTDWEVPTGDAGGILVSAERMRELLVDDVEPPVS